jgi:hypothetical protein
VPVLYGAAETQQSQTLTETERRTSAEIAFFLEILIQYDDNATPPAHLILLDLIILIMFGEECDIHIWKKNCHFSTYSPPTLV